MKRHPDRPVGLGLWIAYPTMLGSDWTCIAKDALDLGAEWIAVRTTDGSLTGRALSAAIKAVQAAGVRWYSWHYSYPTAERIPTQLAHIKRCFDSGSNGHIVNAEIEFTSKLFEAQRLADAIRVAHPTEYVAHAPLGWIDYHGPWPYEEFFSRFDDVMPQMYWTELRFGKYDAGFAAQMQRWEDGFRHGGVEPHEPWTLTGGQRVCPIGVTYGKGDVKATQQPPGLFSVSDLEKFLNHDAQMYECASLYSFEVMREDCRKWLKANWSFTAE